MKGASIPAVFPHRLTPKVRAAHLLLLKLIDYNFIGLEMTPVIISRIERKARHVVDAELKALAEALGVTMEWLCSEE